jgi:hypothetical protein
MAKAGSLTAEYRGPGDAEAKLKWCGERGSQDPKPKAEAKL